MVRGATSEVRSKRRCACQRREFLKAVGAASTIAAIPGCATMGARERQGRGRRRRLWRRDRRQVHPHVERRADRRDRSSSLIRRIHLVPAVEPRARRQQDARRHHGELRQPRAAARRKARPRHGDGDRRRQAAREARRAARNCRTTGSSSRPAWTSCGTRSPRSSTPRRRRRCCTRGKPDRRPSRCAGSWRRCPTAASTRCRFPSRRTGARPVRTSARARSPGISSGPSRDRRC